MKGVDPVQFIMPCGNPVQKVTEFAKEDGVDTIVIGSRGAGKLRVLMLGSVSQKVSHLAECRCDRRIGPRGELGKEVIAMASVLRMLYRVKNIMTREIVCVESTANVNTGINLMVEKDIGSVPVARSGEIIGILTERDVLKKCLSEIQCTAMQAEDVMSSPLVTIDASAAIGQAAELMAKKKIRRLLVTEEGKIRGIITERDVMRAALDAFKRLSEASP